jgi:hypothetical protein
MAMQGDERLPLFDEPPNGDTASVNIQRNGIDHFPIQRYSV